MNSRPAHKHPAADKIKRQLRNPHSLHKRELESFELGFFMTTFGLGGWCLPSARLEPRLNRPLGKHTLCAHDEIYLQLTIYTLR